MDWACATLTPDRTRDIVRIHWGVEWELAGDLMYWGYIQL